MSFFYKEKDIVGLPWTTKALLDDPKVCDTHKRYWVNSQKWMNDGRNRLVNEKDPLGKSAHEPGAKLDDGKSPVFQGLLDYFPRACLAVASVSAAGAAKYAWKGWETVPDGVNRYSNARDRHVVNEAIEGKFDPDGFRHKAQIAWNALAALELDLRSEE